MFDRSTILSEYIGLVGWRPAQDPTSTALHSYLTASSSGLYYNDAHPMLTIKNLKALAPQFDTFTYPDWSAATTYTVGQFVDHGTNFYVCISGHTNEEPGVAAGWATYWRETTPFTEWLRQKTEQAIITCLDEWWEMKMMRRSAHSVLFRRNVLDIVGQRPEIYDASDLLTHAHLCIVPSINTDIIVSVDRVGLHMREPEDMTILLYKNGATSTAATKAVTAATDMPTDGMHWIDVDWQLEPGNFYYLGYDRTAWSGMQPYDSLKYVEGKEKWPPNRFPNTMPYAEVGAFTHAGPGNSGWSAAGWDDRVNYSNYGLNVQLSARCDYTDLFVDQKNVFKTAIQRSVAMRLLRDIAFNPQARINRNEANVELNTMLYEIDGDSTGHRPSGMRAQYKNSLKAITLDTHSLSKECLPCQKTNRIKVRSVWG